jgi:hypothetical protein
MSRESALALIEDTQRWMRHYERVTGDLSRLRFACFDQGHFPNPVGHAVAECKICEELSAGTDT